MALHAVTLSKVTPDDRVLVTGAGPVGLLVTAVLHAQGVRDITVSEPAPVRRERALTVGAARVVTPDSLPKPQMGRPVPEPYTVVFECSGNASAGEAAIDQLDFAGRVRARRDRPRLPQAQPQPGDHPGEHDHRFVQLRRRRVRAALELLASGAMPLDALVEPVDVFLDELLPVMRRCAAGELPGKVMVRPERRTPERSSEVAQS